MPDHPSSLPSSSGGQLVDDFDAIVDQWFAQIRGNPSIDRLFYTASLLGDWSLIWHLVGAARGLGPAGFESAVRQTMALGAESLLVNGIIKSFFRRQRPVPEVARPHHLRTPRSSSFPSGHASSAFLAAGLLSENSSLAPAYYAAAAVVATSRIHVQIHHASDVVAGAALGTGMALMLRRTWPLGRWP